MCYGLLMGSVTALDMNTIKILVSAYGQLDAIVV